MINKEDLIDLNNFIIEQINRLYNIINIVNDLIVESVPTDAYIKHVCRLRDIVESALEDDDVLTTCDDCNKEKYNVNMCDDCDDLICYECYCERLEEYEEDEKEIDDD